MNNVDKASKEFWSQHWENRPLPTILNTKEVSVKNFPAMEYHTFYKSIFGDHSKGKRILEIGCADSVFLPYFNREFGLEVTGLDYSEIGCERSRRMLHENKVNGEIFQCDLFAPPENLVHQFDFVVSNGVIEHFENTQNYIQAKRRFLKTNGVMLTAIPNMKGLTFALLKYINLPVYNLHVRMSGDELKKNLELAGLKKVQIQMAITPSVYFPLDNMNGEISNVLIKKILNKVFGSLSSLCWLIQLKLNIRWNNKFLAAAVLSSAEN